MTVLKTRTLQPKKKPKVDMENGSHLTDLQDMGLYFSAFFPVVYWSIHPTVSEVIGWPSAQPYALGMVFALLALHLHLLSYDKELGGITHGFKSNWHTRVGRGLVIGVLYLCAVLSKSSYIFFPILPLGVDFLLCYQATVTSKKALPKSYLYKLLPVHLPSLLFSFFAAWGTHFLNAGSGTHTNADAVTLPDEFNPRFMKGMSTMVFYLEKAALPTDLRFHYAVNEGELDDLWYQNIESGLLLRGTIGLALVCWALWFCHVALFWILHSAFLRGEKNAETPPVSFPVLATAVAFLLYIGLFLPVSGIVQHGQVQKGGDRYCYLPYLPLVLLASGFLFYGFLNDDDDDGLDDVVDDDDIDEAGVGAEKGKQTTGKMESSSAAAAAATATTNATDKKGDKKSRKGKKHQKRVPGPGDDSDDDGKNVDKRDPVDRMTWFEIRFLKNACLLPHLLHDFYL